MALARKYLKQTLRYNIYLFMLLMGLQSVAQVSVHSNKLNESQSYQNTRKYEFDISTSELNIQHDITINQAHSFKNFKLTPISFAFGRHFNLSESIYTASSLHYMRSDFGFDPRLEVGQFIQQLGFKINSFKVDDAYVCPFFNYGYYQSVFKDNYLFASSSTLDKLKTSESGTLVEVGLNFSSRYFGMISTLKAGKNFPQKDSVFSQNQAQIVAINKNQIDSMASIYYSIGFGILF